MEYAVQEFCQTCTVSIKNNDTGGYSEENLFFCSSPSYLAHIDLLLQD